MGLPIFNSGDTPAAATFEEMADQTIIPIAGFGSLPGSPTVGMTVFVTSHNLYQYWDGSGWVSLPMGTAIGGFNTSTGTGPPIGATEVDVNGSDITWTSAGASERYRYSASFVISGSATPALYDMYIDLDGSHVDITRQIFIPQVDVQIPVTFFYRFYAAAGSHTIKTRVKLVTGSGSGTIASGGAFMLEHVGN